MLDVVIDTNVIISALLGGRTTQRILTAFLEGHFNWVLSPSLLTELLEVISRPTIQPYISKTDRDQFVHLLQADTLLIVPTRKVSVCRDPKDNIFLECAIEARVNVIVTGDNDLLILHPFRGIPIVTPQTFIKKFL